MKLLDKVNQLIILSLIIISFSRCASIKKLDSKIPIELGETYYQNTELGFNILISIKSNANNIILDSVYFRGRKTKLETSKENLFIGRFKKIIDENQDIIMSSDPKVEYGNKPPKIPKKIPFKLNASECMVSYIDEDKVNYFKIENILKKEQQ